MTSSERKLLLPFLRDVASVPGVTLADEAQRLLERFSRKKSAKVLPFPSLKAEKKEKRLSGKDRTTAIREAVMARAAGICEGCRHPFNAFAPANLDHWEGGSGRRRQKASPETCWALCRSCNQARTHNRPSAEHWNEIRRRFCERTGFRFVPHIVHQPARKR